MSDLTADQLSEPKLDRPEAVEFQFVREPAEFKPSRNGRPAKLSTRLFIELCRRIELGKSVLDGCFELGISYKTVWVHVNRRPAFARRYRQAQEIAKAREREEDLKSLGEAVKEDWRVSAWRLERRWPNEFALKPVARLTESSEQEVYGQLTREQLLQLLSASKAVEAEAPKGFSQPALPQSDSQAT